MSKKHTSKRRAQKPQHKGPVRWLALTLLGLAAFGLVVSVYSTWLHAQVHLDADYHSFCAINKDVNCETVALSEYAELLGVPVAWWASLTYLVLGILAALGLRQDAPRGWPLGIGIGFAIGALPTTIALAVISASVIGSFCLLCGALYVVNGLIFGVVVVAIFRERAKPLQALRTDLRAVMDRPGPAAIGTLALIGVVGLSVGLYPRFDNPPANASEPSATHSASTGQRTAKAGQMLPVAALTRGRTDHGSPWIGAKTPLLTIDEFSDYQCPYCSKAFQWTLEFVRRHPEQVRLVHRHLPLDMSCNPMLDRPFHRWSCLAAQAAICAQDKGRFWEFSSLLYDAQRDLSEAAIRDLTAQIGLSGDDLTACIESGAVRDHLSHDMAEGTRMGFQGTPSFAVDGHPSASMLTPDRLEALLAERLGKH